MQLKRIDQIDTFRQSPPDSRAHSSLRTDHVVQELTGAIVRLATTAASGTFENVLVVVAVVFNTWSNAVATTFSPPPEQELKPK